MNNFDILFAKKLAGGGSPPPVLISKNITTNGTYTASEDNADGYSSVSVDVPNTYTQADEGKVVGNGALVSQTAYPTTVTENDTYDTTNYNSITVNVSGGGSSSGTDVVFYDYDGSVVASYSASDFANLSAMPTNPIHAGLTAQGWNWSLADAKAYVASYGKLNIGQMYITSDGKTRLYYVIPKDELTLDLYLTLDEDTELDIDWGDNSQHTTWTSNDGDDYKSHEYSNGGRYTVAITVTNGGFSYKSSGDEGYEDYVLKKLELGSGVTSITSRAFNCCQALTSITIPNGVEMIGSGAFYYCQALTSITIPNGVEMIDNDAFFSCHALTSITIPNGVTSIGDNAFSDCRALLSITIPNGATSIGGNAFSDCTALSSITIPNGVEMIGSRAFNYCQALTSITIPNGVEMIDNDAFNYCTASSSITFESTTPPEVSGDLAIMYTCIIRVPQGSLSDYTSASNYPDPSVYIYEEY